MKKVTAILLILAFAALPALAQDKPKHLQATELDGITPIMRTAVAEVEPNDTYATASGPLTGGDQGTGGIATSTDVDYWAINVNTLGSWVINTDAGSAPALGDSYIHLYGTDGTTQIAADDDSGPGYYSQITYNFTATGTYFIKVRGYSSSYTGNYVLNVAAPTPPPPNDTCANAIEIPFTPGFSVTVSTAGAANDYNLLSTGCTGYATSGPDVVYKVTMYPTHEITLTWDPVTFDASLYVVTDCADLTTCVAGADDGVGGDAETVSFENTTGGIATFFIICDAYGMGSGVATLTVDAVVATQNATWGTIKALY